MSKIWKSVLQGFLLFLLTHSQEMCKKEADKVWYYIYNMTEKINVYYCSNTSASCDGKIPAIQPRNGCAKCSEKLSKENPCATSSKLCELQSHVNLLEDVIMLPSSTTCNYTNGSCFDKKTEKHFFWEYTDKCNISLKVYKNNFDYWTDAQNQTIFIQDDKLSLKLGQQISFCGIRARKTEFEGIVASKEILTNDGRDFFPILRASLPNSCNVTNKKTDYGTDKKWHFYQHPLDVVVYFCSCNSSCKDLGYKEILLEDKPELIKQCNNKFGDPLYCCHKEYAVCRESMTIDLLENKVQEMPKHCNYSDGFCKSIAAFWSISDQCGAVRELYEGYNKGYKSLTSVTINQFTELSFLRLANICGENLWHTNQSGIFASERLLEFERGQIRKLLLEQNEEIGELKTLFTYVVLFVTLCVVLYFFNVIVNFFTLRKLIKSQNDAHNRASLLNCLSQSLTTRYVFLKDQQKMMVNSMYGIHVLELSESKENDLYCTVNNF